MTIAHSVLSLSFRRNGCNRAAAAGRPAAATAACAAPAGLTCAPWEGLYLDSVEADNLQEAPVPNPELERFLNSLMFGE